MNTLIELYDERAIENILAPDMFRPRRIVYLCPGEIAQDRTRQETLAAFFRRRGWEPELIFVETSLFKADRILRQLFTIGERFPDCAIDVTGGSDAALFAAGMFAAKEGVPAFTYSRKKNRFYDISGAAFADELPCGLTYSIEEKILAIFVPSISPCVFGKILSNFPFFPIVYKKIGHPPFSIGQIFDIIGHQLVEVILMGKKNYDSREDFSQRLVLSAEHAPAFHTAAL